MKKTINIKATEIEQTFALNLNQYPLLKILKKNIVIRHLKK